MSLKGSISIYLSLMLILIMALVCSLTESARVNAINAKLRGITYMSADSVFSEYVAEIFDSYGIMTLWKNEAEFLESYNDYVEKNISIADLDIYQGADFYIMKHNNTAISEIKKITDEDGQIFVDQVVDYMKYQITETFIDEFLSSTEIFGQGSKVKDFVNKIAGYQDAFINVSESVNKIQSKVEAAQGVYYNPKTLLGDMKRITEDYNEEEKESYQAQFAADLWNLKYESDQIESSLYGIEEDTEEYYSCIKEAKKAVDDLDSQLEISKEELDEEVYSTLSDQLKDLRIKNADEDSDYYSVGANIEKTAEYKRNLDSLDNMFESVGYVLNSDNKDEYRAIIDHYEQSFNDVDLYDLGLTEVNSDSEKMSGSFISVIGNIFNSGLLKTVVSGKISDKKITTASLPSVTEQNIKASGNISLLQAGEEKIMLSEYAVSHFGNYINSKDNSALDYEAEYILCGYRSDRENLQQTAIDLVLLRSGMNLISFLKDSSKMAEAEALAWSVFWWAAEIPAIISIGKYLIINAWCLAESISDVKTLMAGGKVPTIKDSTDWSVSVTGLTKFSSDIQTIKAEQNGLDYEDYLRILLLFNDRKTISYRCMDMIQSNMCLENEDFRMTECIDSIRLESEYEAEQLFTAFLLVRNLTGLADGKYSFTYTEEYGYS